MKNAHNKSSVANMFGSFFINELEIAIAVENVHEVINFPETIVKMPLAPDFLLGIFNLRGLVIPIINLKKLLGVKNDEVSSLQKVAIIDCSGAKVGIVIDKTSEILRVNEAQLDQMNYQNENSTEFIKTTITLDSGNRIIQVVDIEAIVNIQNIPQVMQKQAIYNAQNSMKAKFSQKKCITFSVSNQRFALNIDRVREIIKLEEIKETFVKYDICLGVITLRGQTIPIVDFTKVLKCHEQKNAINSNSRVILLNNEEGQFGLLVESVDSINTYAQEEINPIPLVSKERALMFMGCIELRDYGNVIFLDENAILSHDEIKDITKGHKMIHGNDKSKQEMKKKTFNRASYLTFRLEQRFAISINEIKEIINYTNEISPTPGVSDSIKGVMNLRGKLITIIDTRKIYNMKVNEDDQHKKILIFEQNSESFGLIVDEVETILNIDQDRKMDVPTLLTSKIRDQFGEDIKEIVTVPNIHENEEEEKSETVLVVLNISPLISRLSKKLVA